MSLHNGVDLVSIATAGVFSKTYGSTDVGNTANLFATLGLLEDAPKIAVARAFFVRMKDCIFNSSKIGSWT